ncbi:hypothetical protein JCGZ_25724 [Jatropha curcas]|uniref:RNase H type-1 domain-containing protein n=1 Tax=Jatropha curcas TaxID=180498 RepID=A0A067JJJ6_JATCU|nr:uncharacterized protein LOC105647037 [Jatropha curcas]KDP24067.1 hypothetical protein JCGZ_25724 [Jatropha curcas]
MSQGHNSFSFVPKICCIEEETAEHILLSCPQARATWFASALYYSPSNPIAQPFSRWFEVIMDTFYNQGNEDLIPNTVALCWQIWKTRNAAYFRQEQPNPLTTIARATKMIQEARTAPFVSATLLPQNNAANPRNTWNPPPFGFLKFNVDAAFKDSTQVAGIAIICRNDKGELIDGLSCRKPCSSALVGEAYALS